MRMIRVSKKIAEEVSKADCVFLDGSATLVVKRQFDAALDVDGVPGKLKFSADPGDLLVEDRSFPPEKFVVEQEVGL